MQTAASISRPEFETVVPVAMEMASEQSGSEPSGGEAGKGGSLGYTWEEPSSLIVNQEHNFSCIIACTRQLLRDAKIERSESELLDLIGLIDGFGSDPGQAAEVLTELHPTLEYGGGPIGDPEHVHTLFTRDPWVAILKTFGGHHHCVIVDRLSSKTVYVRDPWGLTGPGSVNGIEAKLPLDGFLDRWYAGHCGVMIPIRLKGVD